MAYADVGKAFKEARLRGDNSPSHRGSPGRTRGPRGVRDAAGSGGRLMPEEAPHGAPLLFPPQRCACLLTPPLCVV